MDNDIFLTRAKRVFGNKWVKGYYVPEGIFSGLCTRFWRYDVKPETLSRSIGRHDDNGEIIFAGDVLKITTKDTLNEFKNYVDYVCAGWSEEDGQAVYFGSYVPGLREEVKIEVVGNVIDNPEFAIFKSYPGVHLDGIKPNVQSDINVKRLYNLNKEE